MRIVKRLSPSTYYAKTRLITLEMQPLFERWTGNKHTAVIITAFIFSAVHFQFFGFVPRFLLGFYLGYLFVWSRSIWLSATAHFMHNSLSVIIYYYTTQNGIDTDTMDWGAYIPHIIVSLFVVAYGIFLLYKMRVKEVCVESVGERQKWNKQRFVAVNNNSFKNCNQ